jgi:predicted integral membrane protein DUF2269
LEPVLAVTLYQLSVTAHVIAVVLAFGPTYAFPMIQMTAERMYPRALPFALRVIDRINRGMTIPITVLVGITGIYQAIDGPFEFDRDQWMSIGLGLYLGVFALALWTYRPSVMARAIDAAEGMVERAGPDGEITLSDEYSAVMRIPNLVGVVLGVTVLVIIYLMEVKPFTG